MSTKPEDLWEVRNPTTGEYGYLDPSYVKPRTGRGRHPYHRAGRFAWYMVSSDEYALVVRTLNGSQLHVFAALPLLMRPGNVLLCRQKEICEATQLQVPTVSLALQQLAWELIIGKIDGVLTFSPEIAWKGDVAGLGNALDRWRDAKRVWFAERKGKESPNARRKRLRKEKGPSAAPDNLP